MNKEKIVLLVEPSFYGVGFAKAAKKLGCKVVSIVQNKTDPIKYNYENDYDDLLVANIHEEKSVINAINNSKYKNFDAIIPSTDYVTTVTAKVAKYFKKFGTSVKTAVNARNKDLARKNFKKDGVPSAKYAVVNNLQDALKESEKIGYPVILKPTNAASSLDVFFINSSNELKNRFEEIKKFKKSYLGFRVRPEFMIEEFLDGPEFSVELFLYKNRIAFAEVTEKHTTKPPYFSEIMHVFPTSIDLNQKDSIVNVAFDAAKSLGFTNGPTHIEIKLTKEGPKIVEVNGRPGGDNITSDLIQDAYGINLFEETIKLYLGEDIKIQKQKNNSALIRYIFAKSHGELTEIKNTNVLEHIPEVKKFVINAHKGLKVRPPENSDDRLGYFILSGKNSNDLKKLANDLSDKLIVSVK